jgi:hypothetical protein
MSPGELFQARVIWSHILDFEDADLLDWHSWAEETILAIDFVAPYWLCELCVASTRNEAARCVQEDIGLDHGDFEKFMIDEPSLYFGLIYFKYSRCDDWAQEALRTMAEFGDICQYLDAGHWRVYQRNPAIDLMWMTFEERTKIQFRPVAAYALRTVRKIFRRSRHIDAIMRADPFDETANNDGVGTT